MQEFRGLSVRTETSLVKQTSFRAPIPVRADFSLSLSLGCYTNAETLAEITGMCTDACEGDNISSNL